jgi:Fe-S-cluster containining protein
MANEVPDDGGHADVVRGLLYTHHRANANTAELHRASATVQALVDLLVDQGVLDPEALEARRQGTARRLQGEYIERGMAVAVQEFGASKYDFQGGPVIDCDRRLPLCGAACCKLPFALSREDVEEGVVRWDLGRPYMIAHGADHTCVHLDRETRRCGVYGQRPIPCRGYDCRGDTRIWLDFERRVINPRINDPDWPACLDAGPAEEGPCSTTSTSP